jgi:tRNA pseudouridine55 synthase
MKPGLYLVHKPVGPTSFSLVRSFQQEIEESGRKKLGVCHGGTLDPFAEGLLLVLVGQATRLFDHLHDVPKVYVADIAWGRETDNGDPTGRVVAEGDVSGLTAEDIESRSAGLVGWHEQVPPATSSKKVDGEPAYRRVHRGESVTLPPSNVYLHSVRWLEHDLPRRSRVELVCRGGYYVRSFARDLGRFLSCRAHLTSLHRTAIGPWPDPPLDARVQVDGAGLLPWLPSRALTDQEVGALRGGQQIPRGRIAPPSWPLPTGFPPGPEKVRGFHLGRLAWLLRSISEEPQRLSVETELRAGL